MTMKRCGVSAVVLVAVTTVALWILIATRPSSGQSPDDWRQLSLSDFVRVITELTAGQEPLADALWDEIRGQSSERLLQAVSAGTAADYGDLVSLFLWARPVLTADQVTTVLAGMQPPANQLAAWTFEHMRTVQDRMLQAGMPINSVHDVTFTWLAQRDVRHLGKRGPARLALFAAGGRGSPGDRPAGVLRHLDRPRARTRRRHVYVFHLSLGPQLTRTKAPSAARRWLSGSARNRSLMPRRMSGPPRPRPSRFRPPRRCRCAWNSRTPARAAA